MSDSTAGGADLSCWEWGDGKGGQDAVTEGTGYYLGGGGWGGGREVGRGYVFR